MENDLISVIVPVYNSQKYLEECINSIINQDYKNLEIILVNDGSTDNSPEICKSFAEKDSRIKFFSKENGGQASARNYALDRMTGGYVAFVDSDDWIKPGYFSRLHNIAVENGADIVICNSFNNPDEINNISGEGVKATYSNLEYASLLIPDIFQSLLWGKLFRIELFNNNGKAVRCPQSVVEDMGIFPHIAKSCKKVILIDDKLYFYRPNPTGVSGTTKNKPSSSIDRALVFIERYSMASDWVPDTMPLILKKAVWFGVSSFTWYNKENAKKYSEGYAIIKKFFIEHEKEISASLLIDKARKIAAKFIISDLMLPFKVMSTCRPVMKKLINKIYDRKK